MKTFLTLLIMTTATLSFSQNYWGASSTQLNNTQIDNYVEYISFYYGDMLGYQIDNAYKNQLRNYVIQNQAYMSEYDKQMMVNQAQGLSTIKYYWNQLDYNSRMQFRNQMLASAQTQNSNNYQNYNSNNRSNTSGYNNSSAMNSMLNMNQTHLNNMNAISDSGWGNSYEYEYEYDPNN